MRTKERILEDLVFDHSKVSDPIERVIINSKFVLEVLIDIRDIFKDLVTQINRSAWPGSG